MRRASLVARPTGGCRGRSYAQVIKSLVPWELRKGDELYPKGVLELSGEPPVLRGYGDPRVLRGDCISVIGARRATPYGKTCAKISGRIAAECDITLISGGAVGCDQIAGTAAVNAGGKTVVVPGCGADVVYPASSEELFIRAVTGSGCVVSIERWGCPPLRHTFVRRNRIIAALSKSLVVCEAGKPSGTFSTATQAAELGRNVYAIPGSIFSQNSSGTNWLIENGASIVCDEESLSSLIAYDYGRLRMESKASRASRGTLLDALVASPMTSEEIAALLKLDIPRTLGVLAEQEALGQVTRLMDGRFAPTERALLGQNGSR